jgi:hypothetical protein
VLKLGAGDETSLEFRDEQDWQPAWGNPETHGAPHPLPGESPPRARGLHWVCTRGEGTARERSDGVRLEGRAVAGIELACLPRSGRPTLLGARGHRDAPRDRSHAPLCVLTGRLWPVQMASREVLYPTYASRKGAQLLIVERVRHTHKQNKHRAVRFRTRISLSASQLFVGLKRKREHCLCRFLPTEICGKLRISRPCAKLSMCRYVVCFIMLYMFVWRISRETGVALSRSGAFRPATNKRGRSRVRVGASRGTGAVWSLNMGRSPPGCSAGGASGRIRRTSRCPKVRSLESVAKPAVPGARAFRRRAAAVSRPARISDLQRAPPETRTDWAVR